MTNVKHKIIHHADDGA